MADGLRGREFIEVSQIGAEHHGHTAQFELRFSDQSCEWFHCNHERLPPLIHALQVLGQTAHKLRSSIPGERIEVVHSHKASAAHAGVDPKTREIVLRLSDSEGIPIDVLMDSNIARQAIESLQHAILQTQSGSKKPN